MADFGSIDLDIDCKWLPATASSFRLFKELKAWSPNSSIEFFSKIKFTAFSGPVVNQSLPTSGMWLSSKIICCQVNLLIFITSSGKQFFKILIISKELHSPVNFLNGLIGDSRGVYVRFWNCFLSPEYSTNFLILQSAVYLF